MSDPVNYISSSQDVGSLVGIPVGGTLYAGFIGPRAQINANQRALIPVYFADRGTKEGMRIVSCPQEGTNYYLYVKDYTFPFGNPCDASSECPLPACYPYVIRDKFLRLQRLQYEGRSASNPLGAPTPTAPIYSFSDTTDSAWRVLIGDNRILLEMPGQNFLYRDGNDTVTVPFRILLNGLNTECDCNNCPSGWYCDNGKCVQCPACGPCFGPCENDNRYCAPVSGQSQPYACRDCTACAGTCKYPCKKGKHCVKSNDEYKCVDCTKCEGECYYRAGPGQACVYDEGEKAYVLRNCTDCGEEGGQCNSFCETGECRYDGQVYICSTEPIDPDPGPDPPSEPPDDDDDDDEETSVPIWLWIIIIVIVFIFIAVVGLVFYYQSKSGSDVTEEVFEEI